MEALQKKIDTTIVSYDIHNMSVSTNGVEDFLWPVPYADRNIFCQQLIIAYNQALHDFPSAGNAYKILGKYFITEAISVFWADTLKQRLDKQGKFPTLPEHLKLWPAIFSGKPPPIPGFVAKFKNEPKIKSISKKIEIKRLKHILPKLKFSIYGSKIDGMYIKRPTSLAFDKYILSTQRLPLITRRIKALNNKVLFCRADKWFSSISDAELQSELEQANANFENSVLATLRNLYRQSSTEFNKSSYNHFFLILNTSAAMLRIHEKRLTASVMPFPKEIWTGTTGILWDTLLRIEVMRRGGKAVGHDHGAGQGHVDNPFTGFTELWGCSEYITFNHRQAQELAKHALNWPNPDKARPVIRGWQFSDVKPDPVKIYSRYTKNNFKVKNIFFLGEPYDGDRGRAGPSSPDIVYVDWQARLLAHLKDWGYNVVFKIHPETPILPPDYFTKELGARVETAPLENIIDEADLLIFDSVYTSVLKSALQTNIPMMLFDFYNHPWTATAMDLFTKRCSFIYGHEDHQNRRQNNWDEAYQAIQTAPAKVNNHEYFNYYYA